MKTAKEPVGSYITTHNELPERNPMTKSWYKLHQQWLLGKADGVMADLRGADLRLANLREADLREANLNGADLSGANLRGASLRGADLRGANLNGANLREADLCWADLSGANLIIQQAGRWTAYVQSDMIIIGCQRHSVEEWRAMTDDQLRRMDSEAVAWRDRYGALIEAALRALADEPSGERE